MEKETPESTYERCLAIVAEREYYECDISKLASHELVAIGHKVCQLYRTERLKIEAPTDDEIEAYVNKFDTHDSIGHGAKWMRKLLTGI